MTHRHRLPRWLAHLVVASVGATMLSAVVLGAPVQAADNATVPPAARVVHGVELATAVAGGAAAPAAVGTPKGRPLTQQEADAVLARAAARSQNSYTKASSAPSGGSLHTAFSAHAITATTPDQTTLADCLSRSGANTLQGQTLNRWFWCRLGGIGIDYFRIVDNEKILEGTATVDFIAAAVGSNTDRTWRAYFHALPGTVRYTPVDPTWEAVGPSLLMTIGAECANLSQYCTTVGSPESWPWSDWNTLDRWSYQDINSSIIGSTGPDDISMHPWYYRFTGSGGGYTVTPAHTAERTVRCDSATYLAWGGRSYPNACVMYDVIPHLQYDLGNVAQAEVAKHIKGAQDNPDSTWPKESHAKLIPGKDLGTGTNGLHRLSPADQSWADNERVRLAACNGTAPYTPTTGMQPAAVAGQDCDEYPFRSTLEGAANPTYDFSVRAVTSSVNRSAGGSLSWYYFSDRILYNVDQFWVQINGACATACSPPPVAPPVVKLDPAGQGRLNGSFIQPDLIDKWSDATLAAELSAMKARHMSHIVLQWTANSYDKHAGGKMTAVFPTFQAGYTRSTTTDVVDRLLKAADAAGIDVYLGLQTNDQWWSVYADDTSWINSQVDTGKAFAHELANKYHAHASFRGWYLPFEMDNVHFGSQLAQDNVSNLYGGIVSELRLIDSTMPVAIAPFYNGVTTGLYGWQDPGTWSDMWTRLLRRIPVDIIALQDGVGAGHAGAADLPRWFAAMRDAMSTAGSSALLFSDAETFVLGPSGLEPMTTKSIVADINAVEPYVDGYWSFSYNHYQSPRSKYASTAYDNAYTRWAKTGTGDGTDGDLPTTPTGLSATVNSPQQITLSWTAAKDTNSGVAGYHIYRDGELVADKLGTGTSFVDRQLDGSRTYTYQVKAFDGSGNESALSATAKGTTTAMPVTKTDFAECGATPGNAGCGYTVDVAADPLYPDTGGTSLTNGLHGLPSQYGPEWQGRNGVGTYTFTIDLRTSRSIKEIDSTWFQVRSDYVFLPPNVTYSVSADGKTYTQVSTIDIPAVGPGNQAKTYRAIKLSASARYVKVKVTGGDAWSMVDEVEVRG